MNKKHVYVVGPAWGYSEMFVDIGYVVVSDIKDADLVCFTGGADVSPSYYNEATHPRAYTDSRRDIEELVVFQQCIDEDIPMVGICRGGQFLNVMSGGKMYQDVSEHTRDHFLLDMESGDVVYVTSTHHQMMRPSKDAEIVATANEKGYKEHMENGDYPKGNGIIKRVFDDPVDIEVVYYSTTRCLCFQPHPEFNGAHYKEMRSYFASLLDKFFWDKG